MENVKLVSSLRRRWWKSIVMLFLKRNTRQAAFSLWCRMKEASRLRDTSSILPKYQRGTQPSGSEARVDLTVEAMVLSNTKWHPLFTTEELEQCSERLKAYGYDSSLPHKTGKAN